MGLFRAAAGVGMAQLILVRHGQASFGAPNYDELSDIGALQAETVGAFLRARTRPTHVASGTMARQRATAEYAVYAAEWVVECTADPVWNEFDHDDLLGACPPDQDRVDLAARLNRAVDLWASAGATYPYAESYAQFCSRVDAALAKLAGHLSSGDTAVIFTSGGIIARVATRLLQAGPVQWRRLNHVTVNTGLTRVAVGSSGSTLVSFNEHSHLGPRLRTYR